MATVEEEYKNIQASPNRPIPGQSLTNDPDNPAPFERAPEFTSVHKASEYLFNKLIQPKAYSSTMQAVSDGVAIMDITQSILFMEFQEGSFNPDLMMMLVEPLAYMIIALAERLDLDMVIYRGEDEDDDEEEKILGTTMASEKLEKIRSASRSGVVPAGIITPDMEEKIEELPEIKPEQNLLDAPEASEASEALEPSTDSLLSNPKGVK
jgi:hypothetical protein